MNSDEYEKHKISEKEYVTIKNLDYCLTVKNVLVFKMNSKSIINRCNLAQNNDANINSEEVEIEGLKTMDIMQFMSKPETSSSARITVIDEKQHDENKTYL